MIDIDLYKQIAYEEGYKKGYADGSLSVREELITHSEAFNEGRSEAFNHSIEIMNGIDRQVAEIFKNIIAIEQKKGEKL